MKVNVAGVQIDNLSKAEAIEKIDSFVVSGTSHYVVTPYSEMIVFALGDEKYRTALNSASLAVADGVGILWAAKYLNTQDSLLKCLSKCLLNKPYLHSVIKEQITGSRLVYDLVKHAKDKNYSLALVGGADSVATKAAEELKARFPGLKINLAISGGQPFDDQTIKEINDSNSDILLIAYSPPKQELWLYENYQKLNSEVAIGLGGTFDYIAKKRLPAPDLAHSLGLEWLWRLITQPWRIKRIWNAVPVFIWKVYKYKRGNKG